MFQLECVEIDWNSVIFRIWSPFKTGVLRKPHGSEDFSSHVSPISESISKALEEMKHMDLPPQVMHYHAMALLMVKRMTTTGAKSSGSLDSMDWGQKQRQSVDFPRLVDGCCASHCIPQGLVRAGPTIGTKQTLGKRGRFILGFGMDFDHSSWWFCQWGCSWVDFLGEIPNNLHRLGYIGYGPRGRQKPGLNWWHIHPSASRVRLVDPLVRVLTLEIK